MHDFIEYTKILTFSRGAICARRCANAGGAANAGGDVIVAEHAAVARGGVGSENPPYVLEPDRSKTAQTRHSWTFNFEL